MELSLDKSNDKFSSFSDEDIKEKYRILKKQYDSMTKQHEKVQQELYDLKRNHTTAVELKDHLYSEIEAMQKNEKLLQQECTQKCKHLQDELDQVREEKWKEAENFSSTIDGLEQQIAALKREQATANKGDISCSTLDNTKLLDDIRSCELEIVALKEENNALKKSLSESATQVELYKGEMESLKERIECLESNLSSKKNEIESLSEMLHSAQEDLCTANMELQQYKSNTNTIAPKGNSLFAEVDDKRQEMLKTLAQMKEKVCHLNRELCTKQSEVDALMCEKKTLWEECNGQSKHNDVALFRAYERRITDLEKQNYQLNRDIARWFDKHIDPQSTEAAQWVAGVLDHYRKENSRITAELTAASVNNLSAEQKLRDLQRQIVTWRTKALQANASVSELETKLQTLEKSASIIVNSTNLELSPHNADVSKQVMVKKENVVSPKVGFSDIDISAIKSGCDDSVKMKENQPPNIPGILAKDGGSDTRKTVKITTFKQE